jgi:ribonuclease HIII
MNSYTHPLTPDQVARLRAILEETGFQFTPKEYTIFFAQKNKLSVAVYEKGPKVLVQGKAWKSSCSSNWNQKSPRSAARL